MYPPKHNVWPLYFNAPTAPKWHTLAFSQNNVETIMCTTEDNVYVKWRCSICDEANQIYTYGKAF